MGSPFRCGRLPASTDGRRQEVPEDRPYRGRLIIGWSDRGSDAATPKLVTDGNGASAATCDRSRYEWSVGITQFIFVNCCV
jgi:hypothetical protein